jgi:plastocyanin
MHRHMSRLYKPLPVGILIALAVTACGGGGSDQGSTSNTAPPPAATTTPPPAESSASASNAQPATPGAAPAGATAAPITGKTVTVNMIGDAKGYRFEPASVTIKAGDGVKWVNVTGGPHNVTFWPDSMPAGAASVIGANMPNTTSPLTGPLLITPNDGYTVSFAGAKPGVYKFYCTPHLALGMKGQITVQ